MNELPDEEKYIPLGLVNVFALPLAFSKFSLWVAARTLPESAAPSSAATTTSERSDEVMCMWILRLSTGVWDGSDKPQPIPSPESKFVQKVERYAVSGGKRGARETLRAPRKNRFP